MASVATTPSNAQQQIAIPSGTSTVTVALTSLTNGYLYVIPLADGYSGTFPGSYGGQFSLSSGDIFYTVTDFGSDSTFTLTPGDAANVAVVLQRIGGDAASAAGTVSFTGGGGSDVALSLSVEAASLLPAPASASPTTSAVTGQDFEPVGYFADGSTVLGSGTTLFVSPWPDPVSNGWTEGDLQTLSPKDPTAGYTIQAATQLANGRLLVTAGDPGTVNTGYLWISDTSGENFSILEPKAMGYSNSFPIPVTDNTAVVSEYFPIDYGDGGKDGAIKVWSVDGGATKPSTSDISPPNTDELPEDFHHHGIAYDVYEDLYWLVTGDGSTSRSILVMDAKTGDWYQAVAWGELPMQSTNVVPMQDFVLFISDDRQIGAMRYDRLSGGTLAALQAGTALQPVIAWAFQDPWPPTSSTETEIPLGTVPALAADPPAAYWGWQVQYAARASQSDPNPLPNIYTTQDGVNFYEVQIGAAPYPGAGVQGVFGPDSNGNILVATNTDSPAVGNWSAIRFAHSSVWGS